MLIGKRQIFIRFAGCNINCKYCDTKNSITDETGFEYSFDQLYDEISKLMTPDVDSLEITGGEPLLHSDYIYEFLTKYPFKAMLETNATLPEDMKKLVDVIDIVSMDIKLPEHFNSTSQWSNAYDKELETINVLELNNVPYYIKMVVTPTTKLTVIENIMKDLCEIVSDDINIIVQPVSPIKQWNTKDNLFKISEIIGKTHPVSIIPQIHKYMGIE